MKGNNGLEIFNDGKTKLFMDNKFLKLRLPVKNWEKLTQFTDKVEIVYKQTKESFPLSLIKIEQ